MPMGKGCCGPHNQLYLLEKPSPTAAGFLLSEASARTWTQLEMLFLIHLRDRHEQLEAFAGSTWRP
jgi:hypothetical protein